MLLSGSANNLIGDSLRGLPDILRQISPGHDKLGRSDVWISCHDRSW